MRRDEIRRLKEAYGEKAVARKIIEMIAKKKITAEEFSLRALWEGLVGDCDETLSGSHQVGASIHYIDSLREETGTTAFPKIIGALIASKVIEGYENPDYIGDQLVETMKSRHKTETLVGFSAVDGPLEVDEGKPYEDSDVGEKYVTSTATKRGRIISVTEEAIMEDQTGMLLRKAVKIGDMARLDREIRILKGVSGNVSGTYKPTGAAADIYSSGNANVIGTNALVDWTDVNAAMLLFAAQTDDKGNKILIVPKILLVPYALAVTAARITNATEVRQNANPSAGTADQMTVSPNPFSGRFKPLTSPLLDGFTNGTTNWFLGDFKKAFVYHEIWPIQTLAAKEGHEDEFNRDVIFKYKVREYGDVNCLDHRYQVRSAAS